VTLSIFERTFGPDVVTWPMDREAQGQLAITALDAVQTIVDVLVDEHEYRVGFAPENTAYTDFSGRRIVITAKPLTEGGKPMQDIVDVLTAFAVHEVGHARSDSRVSETVRSLWPGKVVPGTLLNILQDVRLEQAIVDRFPGLVGVFEPAFRWLVAQDTARYGQVLAYGQSLNERLDFIGSVARYRRYCTFATDPASQAELAWWADWADITGSTTDDELVQLVRDGLARIHEGATTPQQPPQQPPQGPGPEGPVCGPEGPHQQPDADDDIEDEPKGETKGGDESGEDGEGEGKGTGSEPGDDESDEPGDEPGEGKGEGKSGSDGEGSDPADGDPDADGQGWMRTGETLDRTEAPDVTQDASGKGGSGKAITDAKASDDPDAGLEPDKLAKTMDEVAGQSPDGWRVQYTAETERNSDRITAGAHGSMKVRVRL
jgi:hypothetical protein